MKIADILKEIIEGNSELLITTTLIILPDTLNIKILILH